MNEKEFFLCHVLRCERSALYLDPDKKILSPRQAAQLKRLEEKRRQGYPLAYLIQRADFWGMDFKVTPGVLIPRPETEVLVEEVLKKASARPDAKWRILEFGTGSGNIAVVLAKGLLQARVTSVDISAEALAVASVNARRHGVSSRIRFLRSDLGARLIRNRGRFDFIVSNPPYVSAVFYPRLPRDVRHEPKRALVAARKGLDFFFRIEEQSRYLLADQGMFFGEICPTQKKSVEKIFSEKILQKSGLP